jgi:hypothetical protein
MSVEQPASSLAGAEAGGTYTVRQIVFELLRSHCAELGVLAGDRVSCRAESVADVLIETRAGQVVPCGRELARFVQVVPARAVGRPVVVVPALSHGTDAPDVVHGVHGVHGAHGADAVHELRRTDGANGARAARGPDFVVRLDDE